MAEAVHNDLGPVLVLVNNAGITRDRTLRKMTRQDWDEVIDVDLGGAFNATSAVLPQMMDAGWGRIISISSIIGQMGGFGQTNYAAAKAGFIGWTKALARELAGKGITVNVVAPGFIETDMTAAIPGDVRTKITAAIPMGRFGLPEEVAPIVSFLALPTASYSHGAGLRRQRRTLHVGNAGGALPRRVDREPKIRLRTSLRPLPAGVAAGTLKYVRGRLA